MWFWLFAFPLSSYNTVSAFPFRCFFRFWSKLPPKRGMLATCTSQAGSIPPYCSSKIAPPAGGKEGEEGTRRMATAESSPRARVGAASSQGKPSCGERSLHCCIGSPVGCLSPFLQQKTLHCQGTLFH